MKFWLRWLAVLPGALLGGLLATFSLRWILYTTRSRVKRFKPGDRVFGMQTPLGRMGGYAESLLSKLAVVG